MSLTLNHSVEALLLKRATFFQTIRSFFAARDVIEVDTPILVSYPPNDANIDIMRVSTKMGERYLASSPEYLMKRLLAAGAPDIFQLCHVYRDGELGYKHSPFFTMIEWYRKGFSLQQLLDEVLSLIQTVGLSGTPTYGSYRERFLNATGVDPLTATDPQLINLVTATTNNPATLSRDALLDAAFLAHVEPTIQHGIHIVSSFLPSQAALATIIGDEAQRFEVYINGIEVANGYEELNNPTEIQQRFDSWNEERSTPLVVDPRFLEALSHLPKVSGVAVGADRLLMLQQKAAAIKDILPFDIYAS